MHACLATGCPTNTNPNSGGIEPKHWANMQLPNEIWIDNTGYTAEFEIDRIYSDYENCEVKVFLDLVSATNEPISNLEGKPYDANNCLPTANVDDYDGIHMYKKT